jgi:hypothetical protein
MNWAGRLVQYAGVFWVKAGMPGVVRVRRSIWASLSSAPVRLTLRPSTSPSQPSRSASVMRAVRLSRISVMRPRWARSGQCRGHRRQL